MLNNEIYLVNPASRKIVNEGVASVNDDNNDVLRYELETFVCDGQYEKGLEHILDVYLRNLNQAQQPGVWVSGFYGSGKSHLVKILCALWNDRTFPDGTTARELATLTTNIKAALKDLTTQGKRYGGLHAASGTLGAGAGGSVRLSLLRIIFKSVGLPEQYPLARFVMWLKQENIYDTVKANVEQRGDHWEEELDNLYVAESLHEVLAEVKPKTFSTAAVCAETLNNLYPHVTDVSTDEMVKAIKQAVTKEGKFPLTLVVMDEVQQYIGDDGHRSLEVQEAVEACCKNIGSKLLFIGTGQTAVSGTSNLKKLEGRFTVRIELSDTDVDAVVRKVILAKKPDAIDDLKKVHQDNSGEISRHLAGTTIGYRPQDAGCFTQDYPILPVRRRLWEYTLRVLDQTGTDSQLRNQLSMVHRAAQSNLSAPVGNVIAADYLYFDLADKLLQARVLPKKVHERTMVWNNGSPTDKLLARACGLVFLLNKLSGANQEIGVKATAAMIADLMVTDLAGGSSSLRSALPALLDNCDLLMKLGDEYRIQTEESMAWRDEYESQKSLLANESHRIISDRDDRIRKKFGDTAGKLTITHGLAKIPRDIQPLFDTVLPSATPDKVVLWVRNGWNVDEETVKIDAKQAGNHSPVIYVYIPKRSADELRTYLIEYKAAFATLDKRGTPTTPEGQDARSAMETRRLNAESKINELLAEALSGARVFQAGGNEIVKSTLKECILEAAENALQRLYPNFAMADHPGWGTVYNNAQKGTPDALKAVKYDGDPANHPVCKALLGFIAAGKKGSDIRSHFEGDRYGWSRDAVDGALLVLVVAGQVRCSDEQGRAVELKSLERKQIGKMNFRLENVVLLPSQRLSVKKLLQKVGIKCDAGKESDKVPDFLNAMEQLAASAGGDAPRPLAPATTIFNEIRQKTGNEQLLFLAERYDQLTGSIDTWTVVKEKISLRLPAWQRLQALIAAAGQTACPQETLVQVEAVIDNRLLLEDPDMVTPLVKSLEDVLRKQLQAYVSRYKATYTASLAELEKSSAWQRLDPAQQTSILAQCLLTQPAQLASGTYEELVTALRTYPLTSWPDRIAALTTRFHQAREKAIKELEPEVQTWDIPRRTLRTEDEIDDWLQDIGAQLKDAVKKGPIITR